MSPMTDPKGDDAARLRVARAWAGLQAQEMAQVLGVSASTLNRKENGRAPISPADVEVAIAHCGVPRWFMTDGWSGAESLPEPAETVFLKQQLEVALREYGDLLATKDVLVQSDEDAARAELSDVMDGLRHVGERVGALLDDIATAHLAPVDEARALRAAGRLAHTQELKDHANQLRVDVAQLLASAAGSRLTRDEEASIREGIPLEEVLGRARLLRASEYLADPAGLDTHDSPSAASDEFEAVRPHLELMRRQAEIYRWNAEGAVRIYAEQLEQAGPDDRASIEEMLKDAERRSQVYLADLNALTRTLATRDLDSPYVALARSQGHLEEERYAESPGGDNSATGGG